ncbi:hypothetical protein AA0118_g12621 [Alternaria tenuissima]|nr:hypothetical protein AA0118_g12621 [Alternaria tenuissima]
MDCLNDQSAFESSLQTLKSGSEHDQVQFRSHLFEALRRFMHAPFTPWWTRIWVVQEVTVPRYVVVAYGTISTPWRTFAVAAKSYHYHSNRCCKGAIQRLPPDQQKVINDSFNKISSIDRLRYSQRNHNADANSIGLLDLLTQFRDRKASDPRDKVYALLSMTHTPEGRAPLTPDYSLSEKKVFLHATLESIYTTKSLSVFSTELGRKFRSDLPSWVPDWGAPGGHTYTARAAAIGLYNASLDKATPTTVVLAKDSALRLKATRLMTVDALGEVMLGDDVAFSRTTLIQWLSLWHVASSAGGRSPGETLPERFGITICAGIIHSTDAGVRRVQSYDIRTFESWAKYSRLSPYHGWDTEEASDNDEIQNQERYVRLWKQFMWLWPQDPVSYTRDTGDGNTTYYPSGLNSRDLERKKWVYQFLPIFTANDVACNALLDYRHRRISFEDVPWKNMYFEVRARLEHVYGPDIDVGVEARKHLISDIDNSISVGTLSRRLIIGGDYAALGPAGTCVGDEVFLLSGGKTPFVLRRHEDQGETDPGPRYEIIGDCYVQEWMDGDAERLASCDWMDITLS